jgi:hypothetical protein
MKKKECELMVKELLEYVFFRALSYTKEEMMIMSDVDKLSFNKVDYAFYVHQRLPELERIWAILNKYCPPDRGKLSTVVKLAIEKGW